MSVRRYWLDGPGLVAWLERGGADLTDTAIGGRARTVRHWRRGGMASLDVAESLLIELGLHIELLPDELWLALLPRRRHRLYPVEIREEAVRRVRAGEPVKDVARAIDCSRRSISSWLRRRELDRPAEAWG